LLSRTAEAGLFDLRGKVALVTGASRGLGQAMALALAGAGCDLVVTDRAGRLEETVRRAEGLGRRCVGVSADLARPAQAVETIWAAVRKGFPGVDVLVNNAGSITRGSFEELTLEQWERTLAVNATAPFLLSQRVVPDMKERKAGKIIHVASLLSFQGGIRVAAYTASKGALAQLTKAMANELAPRNIQVNAIAPGYMETDNTKPLREDRARFEAITDRIPAGRWGRPEDLAGAVVFLASAASDYVTGHVLVVDGGWLAR
jgi:2-deoxy-D-gluconate 3-dehydrogenase